MDERNGMDIVDDLRGFLDAGVSPWHAGAELQKRLRAAGFRALDETEAWTLRPGDRVFVAREDSSVLAFRIGQAPPAAAGFRLLLAHTDSPGLRVKPVGLRSAPGDTVALSVEVYGGPLLHTWLDRDLGLAGRVALLGEQGVELRRWRSEGPVARISSLAIHLHRGVNTEGLKLDAQRHLMPLLGTRERGPSDWRAWLAERLGDVEPERIVGWDLCLHDVQGAERLGPGGELLASARLDNLASCHATLQALLAVEAPQEATLGLVLYDHEEVGSRTARGAESAFLPAVLRRIALRWAAGSSDVPATKDQDEAFERALARSRALSVDMAHAVHPAWPERHEPEHRPRLGGGPVLKVHASQAYATEASGRAWFEAACRRADVPLQYFVSRNDLRCGSTVGPLTAALLAVPTADVGSPMLSMHSAREVCAASDHEPMVRALTEFLRLP